jgi:hypothetical protein
MFSIGSASIEVFMDATNVLNIKTMNYGDYATATSASVYGFGFKDQNDFTAYMKSLHLPSEIADKLQYGNIPGDDAPGDYRDFSIDFVPMVSVDKIASVQTSNIVTKALYYDQSTGKYMRYANSQWAQADQGRVDQLLKDKAYIDMPNLSYFTFLNPRSIFWGVRLTFDL